MMTSNTLPHATIIQAGNQNGQCSSPKIPFESSKTMDECRIQVLRQFRKEIINNVRFSDVSETLIACDLVSKEECYEICKLSVPKQILQIFQKIHDIMDILVYQKSMSMNKDQTNSSKTQEASVMEERQKELVKELWNNFITSLRKEHSQLASKMEDELDRITENKLLLKRRKGTGGAKLKKEDIGIPTDFKHVTHYGLITRSKFQPFIRAIKPKDKNRNMKDEGNNTPHQGPDSDEKAKQRQETNQSDYLNEGDPDLQEFFKKAGVCTKHLADPVTRQIIYRFIADNGGMNAIRDEIHERNTNHTFPPTTTPPSSMVVVVEGEVPLSEDQILKVANVSDHREAQEIQMTPPAPATVPFEPTPRPTSIYGYF